MCCTQIQVCADPHWHVPHILSSDTVYTDVCNNEMHSSCLIFTSLNRGIRNLNAIKWPSLGCQAEIDFPRLHNKLGSNYIYSHVYWLNWHTKTLSGAVLTITVATDKWLLLVPLSLCLEQNNWMVTLWTWFISPPMSSVLFTSKGSCSYVLNISALQWKKCSYGLVVLMYL